MKYLLLVLLIVGCGKRSNIATNSEHKPVQLRVTAKTFDGKVVHSKEQIK